MLLCLFRRKNNLLIVICKCERTSVAPTSKLRLVTARLKYFWKISVTSHSCAVYLLGCNTCALEITLTAGNHIIIFRKFACARRHSRSLSRKLFSSRLTFIKRRTDAQAILLAMPNIVPYAKVEICVSLRLPLAVSLFRRSSAVRPC